jgi:hypothetical protein
MKIDRNFAAKAESIDKHQNRFARAFEIKSSPMKQFRFSSIHRFSKAPDEDSTRPCWSSPMSDG